ncbi:MAG TPA: glycosyltransferase family 4 protein [Bacteroidia bacterium]|jgi:glycosyltransferase involved in cell wall biosynthesis|nr:glycosyltransferase family 4 protein [Bacteroidia bacterium]
MKVLQISNKIPYPEKDGGVIAINAITEGLLKAGCEVKLLSMNTFKHFSKLESIPEKFKSDRQLEAVTIDTSIKPLDALLALLTGKSYNISRFQSKQFGEKLSEILQKEKFDIIHLEGLYLTPYLQLIRHYTKAPIILRTHNVEWKIWQKLASEEKNSFKKWYLTILSKQLKKQEEEAVDRVDGIATITNQDLELMKQSGCKVPVTNIPLGIDVSKYIPTESKHLNTLFYIGALDWLPNLQGIDWFLKNVWNKVLVKFPGAQFHIAGRNMPESLRNSNYRGVVFHGEVEDAKSFIADYDIMLVPLLAGSGVRVKIIEGMAIGKAIVTTSVGIDGIDCNYTRDVLVADTPEKFAELILLCLSDANLKRNLELNARKFVDENYDMAKTSKQLIDFYKERIGQQR